MSLIAFISFSKKLPAHRFSDIKGKEKEFGITYDTKGLRPDILLFPDIPPSESDFIVVDKKEATFNNCFENLFIYGFCANASNEFGRQKYEIMKSALSNKIKEQEICKLAEKDWAMHNKKLHDFLDAYTSAGEFVEIYSSWHDHVNFIFGPPTSETIMKLKDVLTRPYPKKSQAQDERPKTVIHKSDG
jgi:hypothetical protein